MEPYYFETREMAVGYRSQALIEEISLKLEKGRIMTLIGPNGSGKSTILKSVTRQLALIRGSVYLEKQSLSDMKSMDVARKMSMVMTGSFPTEYMTCQDVVEAGRYPYTKAMGILGAEDRKKVQEAMELVNARELADLNFAEVSDGQRQRILLARAICQEPELIVLDEPTSFLDIRHKLELLDILKKLTREKRVCVLMSLHELDLAQKISDHVVCVSQNRIDRIGTPEEIFTSEYIGRLYQLEKGVYNADFGSVELIGSKAAVPEVFVIGGGGSGIPVYRKLQREGIAFAAGILHENDVEAPVAERLAVCVIAEKAFEPISEETFLKAAEQMKRCKRVICTLKTYGSMNQKNRELTGLAERVLGAERVQYL